MPDQSQRSTPENQAAARERLGEIRDRQGSRRETLYGSDIEYLLSVVDLLQQPATSERCVKCGHERRYYGGGQCRALVLSPSVAGSGMAHCGHTCAYPATGAGEGEQRNSESVLRPLCAEHPHVSFVDGVLGGTTPLINRTRFRVSNLLWKLAIGMPIEEIKETWHFDDDMLRDAFAYVQDVLDAVTDRERGQSEP